MILPTEQLSLTRQCQLLKIPRSTYYSVCKGESAYNLKLMRMIDEKFLEPGSVTSSLLSPNKFINNSKLC